MKYFDLDAKQGLLEITNQGVVPLFPCYDNTKPNTSNLESDATSAGSVEYYKEVNDNLVEIIYLSGS